jgi:bifunctional DNA-binding transcriptional regulator/antitoxin component of YhaV-PrlF toxin-antitoxin module
MEMESTKVTTKYQTTIPRRIRKKLKVSSGGEVFWYVVKEFVIVGTHKKIKNPVDFITSKIKLDLDAVKLVNEARADFS